MSWIIIARTCSSCGGDLAFEIFKGKPRDKDIEYVKEELGGNFCIKHWVQEIGDGVNVIENNED